MFAEIGASMSAFCSIIAHFMTDAHTNALPAMTTSFQRLKKLKYARARDKRTADIPGSC